MRAKNVSEEVLFTGNVSISHVMLYMQEPDVSLFSLYGNLVSGKMELINILCDFNQLNNLLSSTTDGAEEAIEKVSDLVSTGFSDGEIIDLTETGGLHFNHILFCLEPLYYKSPAEEPRSDSCGQYILRDFITEGFALKVFEKMCSYRSKTPRYSNYHCSLAIQFEFYQRFKEQRMKENEALRLSGLKNKSIFMLAINQYYGLKQFLEQEE